MIIFFHGFGSNAVHSLVYTKLHKYAKDFLVVYPDSPFKDHSWNAGACCGDAKDIKFNNEEFAKEIIDDMEKKGYNINRKNIFATGFSNGGALVYKFACTSDIFAGIAAVMGNLANIKDTSCAMECKNEFSTTNYWKDYNLDVFCFDESKCREGEIYNMEKYFECNVINKIIPIISFNSIDDLAVPINGLVSKEKAIFGTILPLENTINVFKRNYDCSLNSDSNFISYQAISEKDRTMCLSHKKCLANITSCISTESGHYWHPYSNIDIYEGVNQEYLEICKKLGKEVKIETIDRTYWSRPAESIDISYQITDFFTKIVENNEFEERKKIDL